MALSIVNVGIPALSWKKRLANNSPFGKAGISRPAPSPISKIRNSLQANGQPKSDEVLLSLAESEEFGDGHKPHKSFPTQFYFGAASSAFQVEGSTKEGGRGPSIWDTFCEKYPNKIVGGANGDPGAGSYKYYKRDVQLLANMGVNSYRFSISWARVLPNGRVPNEEGIAYYNNLINELKANNIEPFVTLFHWDMPQALEDEYGGFLSRRVVKDFKTFAKLCFDRFGDRVKHWITLNEPSMFSEMGYSRGLSAPGHCTPDLYAEDHPDYSCPTGDSLREPYIVGHNLLLAHAEAVDLYRSEYKTKYGGEVGITLCSMWYEPYNSLPHNKEAAQRALDFSLGWFFDPLKFGRYPFSMRALVGDRLPILTPEESKKIKNSFDFIGFNYYSARYARDKSDFNHTHKPKTSSDDSQVSILVESGGLPIGPSEKDSWVLVYPKGLRKILLYIKDRYNNPPIYITENGVFQLSSVKPDYRPGTNDLARTIDDLYRIEFHTAHLQELEEAISNKAQIKGYFVWSLLDSFEWVSGYSLRFGLNHVNYHNMPNPDLTRTPKQSAHWYADYIKSIRNGRALDTKLFEKAIASLVVRGDP